MTIKKTNNNEVVNLDQALALKPVDRTTAVRVEGLTKYYKIYDNFVTGPIKERLFFWKADQYYQRFAALRNISLEVKRGEVVGIIGPNGSGKTTLLKSIAGMLYADEGSIYVNGKVTALLAQGVGVHPEFSGRENVYFSALMLGMSREEINERMESIIEFAELGSYIDRPFRTYSAGMRARLLFSISMSISPDILIIDEALSAGDSYFVRKCRRRIQEICDSGATVLFVSHDPTQVEALCDHGVFMVKGQIVEQGKPADMVRKYYDWVFDLERGEAASQHTSAYKMLSGTGDVIVEKVTLLDKNGNEDTAFYAGDAMTIRLDYYCPNGSIPDVRAFCGLLVRPSLQYISEMDSSANIESAGGQQQERMFNLDGRGYIDIRLDPILLINNTCSLWIKLYSQTGSFKVLCEYRDVAPFFVSRKSHSLSRGPFFWHPFKIDAKNV